MRFLIDQDFLKIVAIQKQQSDPCNSINPLGNHILTLLGIHGSASAIRFP